jgi:hypothetical protein
MSFELMDIFFVVKQQGQISKVYVPENVYKWVKIIIFVVVALVRHRTESFARVDTGVV